MPATAYVGCVAPAARFSTALIPYRPLNPGSSITVVADHPLPEPSTSMTPETTPESWSELRVIVVEDSTIVRERLIRLLTALANVRIVAEATTAAEAIDRITELQPDFVTL